MNFSARFVALASLLALSSCSACGDNDAAILRASSLTKPQLAQMAADLRKLAVAYPDGHTFHAKDIPREFELLKPVAIESDPVASRIYLSGCVDDKVLIVFWDLPPEKSEDSTPATLELLKGEQGGSVVLWSE